MKKFFLFFIFLISNQLIGQESILKMQDSLKKLVENSSGIKKVDLISEYAYFLKDIDPYQGLEMSDRGIELAKDLNYIEGEIKLTNSKGMNYLVLAEYKKSITCFLNALDRAKEINTPELLGLCYNNIGLFFYFINNSKDALDNFAKAIKYREEHGEKKLLANTYNNTALAYIIALDYYTALEYLYKSLKIKRESKDYLGVVRTLSNIILCLRKTGQNAESYPLILEALDLSIKTNYIGGLGLLYEYLGLYYLDENKNVEALRNLDIAMEYFRNAKLKSGEIQVNLFKADALTNLKDYKGAIKILSESLKEVEKMELITLQAQIYLKLGNSYKSLGDINKALYYNELLVQTYDSLLQIRKERTRLELNASFNTLKIEEELKDKEKSIQTQTRIIILLIVSITIVIFFAIFTFRIFIKNKEVNKQLNESRSQLSTLLNNLQSIVYRGKNDAFWTMEYISDGCYDITGYKKEEFLEGKIHWKDLIIPNDRERVLEEIRKSITESFSFQIEYQIITKENTLKWILDKGTGIKTNGVVESIDGFMMDITAKKLLEEQLIIANKTKDKFISIISHDLRGPFHGFLGFSEILAEESDKLSKTEIKTHANQLHKALKIQFKFLEDLLSWSRLQLGREQFNVENLSLQNEVNEIIVILEYQLQSKHISVKNEIDKNIIIKADKNLFQIVLRNIIGNSIKYTRDGGRIEFNVEESDRKIAIIVKDNGVGMSNEKISKLFKIDEQHSTKGTNNEIGSGLGLLICKEIMDRHNGTIKVESELDKGTSFILEFPK